MKNLVLAAASAAFVLTSCAMKEEPCCASYPIKPFKAVYDLTANGTPAGTQTWLSDGKGKVMMSSGNHQKAPYSTLVDYANGKVTILDEQNKTAEARPLETPWVSNASMEQLDATALGDKTIDGHPCKGWKVTKGDTTTEYWLGDDTACYIEVNSTNSKNEPVSTLKLVDYSAQLPEGTTLTVPSDYKMK